MLYRAPEISWSDLLADDIICYSTEIDNYELIEIEW